MKYIQIIQLKEISEIFHRKKIHLGISKAIKTNNIQVQDDEQLNRKMQ